MSNTTDATSGAESTFVVFIGPLFFLLLSFLTLFKRILFGTELQAKSLLFIIISC
jgi:hypothetical protein